jgi:hypothetical protein
MLNSNGVLDAIDAEIAESGLGYASVAVDNQTFIKNNSIVLAIRYDWSFDESGNADVSLEKEKASAMTAIRDRLQAQLSQQLGYEVVVFIES